MKYSLLDMTQNILSSMDSDEVNSITDTTEARQVANVIRTTYFNIIARADLPEHRKLFQLVASTDVTTPILMTRPDTVSRIEWIKYDTSTDTDASYDYVTILPVQQFIDYTQNFSTSEDNTESFSLNSLTSNYHNDGPPRYCTIIDDLYLVFDSYDAEVDSTLQSSKTLCRGQTIPIFALEDAFVPELDEQQFPLLLNEAKSVAFMELKQQSNPAAVQESRRQWRTLQRSKSLGVPNDFDSLPNFGRR